MILSKGGQRWLLDSKISWLLCS